MRLWRLCPPAHAPSLDGEGARRFGGRWNRPGRAMLYTSGSLALATLEVLVHMAPERRVSGDLPIMVAVEIDLPEALIQKAVDMPLDRAATQSFGDAWLAECAALALEVPSRVIPVESNVLINPAHPQAASIRLIRQIPFVFDDRLGR